MQTYIITYHHDFGESLYRLQTDNPMPRYVGASNYEHWEDLLDTLGIVFRAGYETLNIFPEPELKVWK